MLNKIPVLDKGYVALRSSSLAGRELQAIENDHFSGKINRQLWNVATLTLEIRCPIFVQLFFQQVGLTVINTVEQELDCYTPDLSEVKTGDHAIDKEIVEHIKQTTEALKLTNEGFERDGLDRFMANVLMPVSVYNTVIVSGNLNKWMELLKKKTPKPITAYREAIYAVAEVEWDELDVFMGKRNGKKKETARAKERDREGVRTGSDIPLSSSGQSNGEDKGKEV